MSMSKEEIVAKLELLRGGAENIALTRLADNANRIVALASMTAKAIGEVNPEAEAVLDCIKRYADELHCHLGQLSEGMTPEEYWDLQTLDERDELEVQLEELERAEKA